MYSIWGGRAAETKKFNDGSDLEDLADAVPARSLRCAHDVVTQCSHCAAIATAERLIRDAKPKYLEPSEHAHLILKTMQEAGDFGPHSHEEILDWHRELCANENLIPVPNPRRNLLREFGESGLKLAKMRRRNSSGSTTTCYVVPKRKDTKVLALSRGPAS